MQKEEFVKEQMKLSKEDIIANYWYTYQDNVERLGIEHQLNLKDKEIERLNKENKLLKSNPNFVYSMRNNKAIEYIENYLCSDEYIQSDINSIANAFVKLVDILKGVNKE